MPSTYMIKAYVRFSSLMLPEHAGARHVLALCLALLICLDRMRAQSRSPSSSRGARALGDAERARSRRTLLRGWSAPRRAAASTPSWCRSAAGAMRTIAALRAARRAELAARPGFDPLAETIDARAPRWPRGPCLGRGQSRVERGGPARIASAHHLSPARLADGAAGAGRGADRSIRRAPQYVARLARWTRARPDEVEGLYASPIHPWAATHLTAVITELVTNYDVDGLHLDYVRFPNEDFDYSRAAIQQFKRDGHARADRGRSTACRRPGASGSTRLPRPVSRSLVVVPASAPHRL